MTYLRPERAGEPAILVYHVEGDGYFACQLHTSDLHGTYATADPVYGPEDTPEDALRAANLAHTPNRLK